MRLFTALPLDPQTRAALSAVQARLSTSGASVKWNEPDALCLTVSAIGDIADDSLLPEIAAVCETLARKTAPFRFRLRGVSVFPRRGDTVRTVLMDITDGADEWRDLARRAEPLFAPFGMKRGDSLAAHITLGRVRGDENIPALREAVRREADADAGGQVADRLVLMETVLDPRGATFRDRGSTPFGRI